MRSRRGVSELGFALLSNVLVPLATFATAPLLAYGLGVAGRGEVAAATAPLILLLSALTLGLPEALTYWVAKTPLAAARVAPVAALLAFAWGLVGLGAVAIASEALSSGNGSLGLAMIISATMLPPALAGACVRGFAIGLGRWRLVVAERALSGAVRLGGVGGLFVAGQLSVLSACVVLAISYGVAGIPYLLLWRSIVGGTEQDTGAPGTRVRELARLSSYGVGVWAGAVGGIVLSRLDQVLLAPLSSTYELGLYAAAINIAEIVLVFNNAVRDVMFARLSRTFDAAVATIVARVSFVLCAVPALLLVLLGSPLIGLAFGEEFEPAYWPLVVLVVALWAGGPGSVAGAALNAIGSPWKRSMALLIGAGSNVVCLIAFAPLWGALGAALATLAGSAVAANLNILLLRAKGFRVRDFYVSRRSDFVFAWAAIESSIRRKPGGMEP